MSIEGRSESLPAKVTRRDVLKWGMGGVGGAVFPELAGCRNSKETIQPIEEDIGYYKLPKGLNVKIFTFDSYPLFLQPDLRNSLEAATKGIKETQLQDSTEGLEVTSTNPEPFEAKFNDSILSIVKIKEGNIFNVASPNSIELAKKVEVTTDKNTVRTYIAAYLNVKDKLETEFLRKNDPETFNKYQKDGELEKDLSVYIVVPKK